MCIDAQADLHSCCLHTISSGFFAQVIQITGAFTGPYLIILLDLLQ